jgi:hypothetical protein
LHQSSSAPLQKFDAPDVHGLDSRPPMLGNPRGFKRLPPEIDPFFS